MQKIKKAWEYINNDGAYYFMLLPGVILVILFNYLPIGGIFLAFKEYKPALGIWGSEWVGFENFKAFFNSPDLWIVFRNTIGYNIVFIVTGIPIAVGFSILLNEIKGGILNKAYQTIALMPHFLSYVIVAYLVYAFLGSTYGIMNKQVLPALGIEPISWYTEPKYWPFILFIVANWKEVGYSSILYLTSIAGINTEYYEAARIDGANRVQLIRHITIPHLRSIICLKLIMSIGALLGGNLGLFYNVPMNSGPLYSVTTETSTYMYRMMGKTGYTTAAGIFCSLIGLMLVLLSNAIIKKVDSDSALF